MATRIERDRHFDCQPGACKAPAPSAKRLQGRPVGQCIQRRNWWLRTTNQAGKRVSIAFKTEGEAREAARKVEAAAVLGQDYRPNPTVPKAPTFAKIAVEAMELYTSTRSLRQSTKENHAIFLKNHLIPVFGEKPVIPEFFSRLEIKRFIAAKRKVLADSSLKTCLPILAMILDHAVERGDLPANPMRTGEPLWRAGERADVDPFNASELRAILKASRASDPDFAVLIQLMAQAGLRPGEAMAIRRGNVNLEAGTVDVRGTWSRGRLGPPKNRHSTRTVSVLHPITEDTTQWRPGAAGMETRRVLDGLGILVAVTADQEAPLFPAGKKTSEPMNNMVFDRTWRRILKASGIRYRKPHTARHSFASILLSRNAPLTYIQKAGGWKSATVLLGTYAKWVQDDLAASSVASSPSPAGIETSIPK
jgi:integrase